MQTHYHIDRETDFFCLRNDKLHLFDGDGTDLEYSEPMKETSDGCFVETAGIWVYLRTSKSDCYILKQ